MLNQTTLFNVLNFIVFQASWFLLIVFQNQYLYIVVAFNFIFLVVTRTTINHAFFLLTCAVIGVVIDSALATLGVLIFEPLPSVLPIPAWLCVIWISFASTIRHSMAYLGKSTIVAAVVGAIAGPISYFAGMRLGAVDFGYSTIIVLAIYAVIWALLLPTMFILSDKIKLNFP